MVKPDVDVYQNVWELDHMLAIVERVKPKKILEVGSWEGGTLWHWLQIADLVVSVDDGMRRASDWEQWAKEADSDLVLVQGISQDEAVVEKAREFGPYDFIFIDADHRYAAVKADWENYREMLADGGVFAFHDVSHPDPDYGVDTLWAEITSQHDVHWVQISLTNHCGIGMLWYVSP